MGRRKGGNKSNKDNAAASVPNNVSSENEKANQNTSKAHKKEGIVIGIDFGTTHSSVGLHQNHKPCEIIANELGHRSVPSVVNYGESEVLVGEPAAAKIRRDASNTITDVKRFLGRKFNSHHIQHDLKSWAFTVKESAANSKKAGTANPEEGGYSVFEVEYQGKPLEVSAEEVSAVLLKNLRKEAEAYSGKPVLGAVIAVPSSFSTEQREAVLRSAKLAKLNVLQLISEASAAVLAYGLDEVQEDDSEKSSENSNAAEDDGDSISISSDDEDDDEERDVLVFDLGGGSFSLSLLSIHNGGLISLRSSLADETLGGEKFDDKLVEHFLIEFERKYRNSFIRENKRSIRRLRIECERAKRVLSQQHQGSIAIDSFFDGIDFMSRISRARFEDLISGFVKRMRDSISKILEDSELDIEDVDDVILVGGCSRIPVIQRMLAGIFGAEKLKNTISPEEVVGLGATIQAGLFSSDDESCEKSAAPSRQLGESTKVLVTPLSIGIKEANGLLRTIVPRNSVVPLRRTINCTTGESGQSAVVVSFYQGERPIADKNVQLAQISLEELPGKKVGELEVEVTVEIGMDMAVNLEVIEDISGKAHMKKVESDFWKRDGLTQEEREAVYAEVEKLLAEAEENFDEDEEMVQRIEAMAECKCLAKEQIVKINSEDPRWKKAAGTLKWLEEVSGDAGVEISTAEVARRLAELRLANAGITVAEPEPTTDEAFTRDKASSFAEGPTEKLNKQQPEESPASAAGQVMDLDMD